jgi:hypothetical protein
MARIKYYIKNNQTEFNQVLQLYCELMNSNTAQLVKNVARLFCKDMVQYTPPFSAGNNPSSAKGAGMDTSAHNWGKTKVSSQIRRIFSPIAQAPAQQVAEFGNMGIFNAWMNAKQELPPPHQPRWIFEWFKDRGFLGVGEWELFKKYEGNSSGKMVSTFWSGTTEGNVKSLHEAKRGKPMYNVKETNNKVYVDDWSVVERYIKRVQTRVGKLKSGWYYAGLALGKMPNVAWISKQGGADKICVPKLSGNKPMVTVGTHGRERYRRWWPLMQLALKHRSFVMKQKMFDLIQRTKDPKSIKSITIKLQKALERQKNSDDTINI